MKKKIKNGFHHTRGVIIATMIIYEHDICHYYATVINACLECLLIGGMTLTNFIHDVNKRLQRRIQFIINITFKKILPDKSICHVIRQP